MKYLVINQADELVARCETATVAALLVLALSDGFAGGAKIHNAKGANGDWLNVSPAPKTLKLSP